MDWLTDLIWHDGMFLGIRWGWWKVIGWLGNAVFFSRFFVQWYATEKLKRVVVPTAYHPPSPYTWLPYIRNLVIHHRHASAHVTCPNCDYSCPPQSNYCMVCGTALIVPEESPAS